VADKQKRPMTADQKRARGIILITLAVIVVVAIGIGWLITSLGAPLWLALAITVVVAGAVSLFMFLEMS
jgi:fatty acid desaturase